MDEVCRISRRSARDASDGLEPELDFTPREDSYTYMKHSERCLQDGFDLLRQANPDASEGYGPYEED
jgi:hypothetical protein